MQQHGSGSRRSANAPRTPGRTKRHDVRAAARPPAYDGGRTRVGRPENAGGRSSSNGGAATRKGKRPRTTARIVVGNLLKALLVFVCIGVIGVSVAGVQVCAYVVESTADDDQLLDLNNLKLPQNGYILAQDPDSGEWLEYQKLVSKDANSVWVPLDKIPQSLVDALISTEDRTYYKHHGVNWTRTARAFLNQVFGFEEISGGSTITQQLVKNLTNEKTVVDESGSMMGGYQRKVKEIFRARFLDNKYGKDLVLEAYFNTMPLSGTIVGVQAAAREYFNKDVADLTVAQSALIVGITQNPSKYNPYKNPEAAIERRDDVLTFMWQNGTISEELYQKALSAKLGLYDGPRMNEATGTEENVTSYFSDAVFEAVVNDLVAQGICASREAAVNYYYTQGLRIESTVDLRLQKKMEDVYENGYGEGGLFPDWITSETETTDKDGNKVTQAMPPQSAMATVRYDGSLAGIVGGVGEKTVSLGLNRATQSPRAVGSAMKPVAAYPLGIDNGLIHYSSRLPDTYVIPEQNWPVNYGPTLPTGGSVLVCDAIAESTNTIAAHVGEYVGVEPMYEFAAETLGITTLVNEGDPSDLSLSPMVLGALTHGITATELANAYTMYGGEDHYGAVSTLHCYQRVLDSQGNIIMEPDVVTMQAVSEETGYIMNRLLMGVLDSPIGTAHGQALTTSDSAGKTGTTNDEKDRWFVGLSPEYVTAIWWGFDSNEPMPIDHSTNPPPTVWRTIIDDVQAQREHKVNFPTQPEGVVERSFCRDTGLLAGTGCSNLGVGYYNAAKLPDTCPGHIAPAAGDSADATGAGENDDD